MGLRCKYTSYLVLARMTLSGKRKMTIAGKNCNRRGHKEVTANLRQFYFLAIYLFSGR